MWRVLAPDEEELARVTTLQFLLEDSHDFENAITLLESTPSLSSLAIELYYDDCSLLKSCARLRRGPRKLRSLLMRNVHFTLGSSTIAGLVELEELEELQLISCEKYSYLLRDIKGLPMKLKAFCIEETDETTELFNSTENDFLRSLKPLVRISLTIGSYDDNLSSLLDWSALQAHASTLQYLRVEYTWPELPFSKFQSGFAQFCKASLNLQLLAISGVTVGDGDDDIVHFLVRNGMNTVFTNLQTNYLIDMHQCPTFAESPRAHCLHERSPRCCASFTSSFRNT
jgi:hypothetical protein